MIKPALSWISFYVRLAEEYVKTIEIAWYTETGKRRANWSAKPNASERLLSKYTNIQKY